LYIAGICATFVLELRAGLATEHLVEHLVLSVSFGAFAIVGAWLVAKRPRILIGWMMAAIALMEVTFSTGGAYATYVMVTRGNPDALVVFGAWTQNWYWYLLLALALIYLPLLFPDERLPSRRWLPVAVLGGISTSGIIILEALRETLIVNEGSGYKIENPIGIEGLDRVEHLPIFGLLNILFIVGVVGAGASVVVRYRRSGPLERQQTKWFANAEALILLVAPVAWLLPDILGNVLFAVVLTALPAAICIEIIRYRLYDMDFIIIGNTFIFGSLSVVLTAVYGVTDQSLEYLIFRITGVEESRVATAVAGVVVGISFNPLRQRIERGVKERIQRAVDKLVYRRIGEAEERD
jgi:hypothetical protein